MMLPNRTTSTYFRRYGYSNRVLSLIKRNVTNSDSNNISNNGPTTMSTEKSHNTTTTTATPRFTGPPIHQMTKEQKQTYDNIIKSRPTTGISGPFQVWLSVPKIANPSQELGKVCRYDTSLSKRESEIIILLTAAKMKSHTEFDIHASEALLAGVENDIIIAIKKILQSSTTNDDNNVIVFTSDYIKSNVIPLLNKNNNINNQREIALVNFVTEMLENYKVSDETYNNTKIILDDKDEVLVEVISIVGYYMYVALTLNVFQIQP